MSTYDGLETVSEMKLLEAALQRGDIDEQEYDEAMDFLIERENLRFVQRSHSYGR